MSPKGTGRPTPSPPAAATSPASATPCPAPCATRKFASEVLSPDRRKKFSSGGATYGPCGPDPQGLVPLAVATVSGFEVALATANTEVPGCTPAVPALTAATALRQFATSSAGFTGFIFPGRFKCRPPVALYATFKVRLCPRSRSMPNEICCTYGV